MPVRFASLSRRLQKNGQRLHLVIASRAFSHGPEQPADAAEQALREERRLLREQQGQRRARALLPKPKAVKPVKEAKPARAPKPKAAKPPKEAKAAKAAKTNKPSRAEKQTTKAANLEAAKKAAKKSAKT